MNLSRKARRICTSKFFAALTLVAVLTSGRAYVMSAAEASYPEASVQQETKVSGVIVDTQGQPVPGASVIQKGTTNGIMSAVDGSFTIFVPGGATLQISCIGYTTIDVKSSPSMRVVLSEDNEFLDEVVVVGYGTQKKANLTGAVSTVDVAKTLEARPVADIGKALQGSVPGLTVLNSSGSIGGSPTITIRGLGTLSNDATSNPLIIVDGVAMEDISYLNPNDIENVSVLKDAASTSIYGSRAAFGVILITTKSAHKMDKVTVSYTSNFSFRTPTVLPEYPSAYEQMKAFKEAKDRVGATPELFGMVINDNYIEQARQWGERHGWQKAGYREVVLGDDLVIATENTYLTDANGNYILDSKGNKQLLQSAGQANYYADWDVAGIFYKKWTPAQTHNFALQGTTGRVSYYLSFGYDKEEGTARFAPEDLKKWNVMANLTSDVTDWLQLGARISYDKKNFSQPYSLGIGQGSLQYIWRWGSFFGPYGTLNGDDFRTIAYRKQSGYDVNRSNYFRVTGFGKIKFMEGLVLNMDYTYNVYDSDRRYSENKIYGINNWSSIASISGGVATVTPGWIKTYTAVGNNNSRNTSYAFNAYLDYTKTFGEAHNFHAMAGANAEEGEFYQSIAYRQGLLDMNLPEFGLATGTENTYNPDSSGWYWQPHHTHWGTAGFFARLNYDYKGIYLLELNGRYDGSSRFPENQHWAFFPSASAGYRFSEEAYFEPLKNIVSNGKFRASFGEIGNEAIGSNMFLSTISPVATGNVNWVGDSNTNKVSMFNAPTLVSDVLSWERIQTLDLGLDLGFLQDELTASFDWYQRNTLDMLAPAASMPATLGAAAPYQNNGTLRTRGWELSLDWHHLFGKDLMVYANASIGDFKSVITKWDNDAKVLNTKYAGMTYGDIWGFESDRLFTPEDFTGFKENGEPTGYAAGVPSQEALENGGFHYGVGDMKYKDLNGDGKIDGGAGTADDHGDLKVIGNIMPRYQYSFRLGASWKGFDVDAFFQGVGKRDVWTQSSMVYPCVRNADATIFANELDYWKGSWDGTKWTSTSGYDTHFARLWSGGNEKGTVTGIENGSKNFYPQSRYLTHMAYLRLKNLTIGYTLPRALTQKVNIEKVRVYFSGENLLTFDHVNGPFDPETGGQGAVNNVGGDGSITNSVFGRIDPFYSTYSFGIQITL